MKHHYDPISTKTNGIDFAAEHEFAYTLVLMIIPYHHLVCRITWVPTSTHYRYQITPKEHLNNTNSTGAKYTAKCLPKGIRIVDNEAIRGSRSEASLILIPAYVQ